MARAQASRALDSGARRHITDVGKEKAVGSTEAINPLALQTILGPTTLNELTEVMISMLGKKNHLHADGTPSVLSLGQLVEDDLLEAGRADDEGVVVLGPVSWCHRGGDGDATTATRRRRRDDPCCECGLGV